ncbi:MAG: ABC transporter permease [Bacteroidaceae bacterium]|nr:ABC transporter permease [Bacteroidaceae bacterium]
MRLIRKVFSSIRQYKLLAVLNIFGLSIAFMLLLILLTVLHHQLFTNCNIKESERIFRLDARCDTSAWDARHVAEFTEEIVNSIPHVESYHFYNERYCYAFSAYKPETPYNSITLISMRVVPASINLLGFELIEGDWETLFNKKAIAVTEEISARHNLKIGDCINILTGHPHKTNSCEIAAIYKRLPHSDISMGETLIPIGVDETDKNAERTLLVKLHNKHDVDDFLRCIPAILDKFKGDERFGKYNNVTIENIEEYFRLVPLDSTGLYYADNADEQQWQGDFVWTIILLITVILFIAFTNYFNFFVSLMPMRIRTINIYKIMGGLSLSIRMELIMESIIIVIIALLVSAFTMWIVADYEIINILWNITFDRYLASYIVLCITAVVTAIATALYPAYYTTSFTPSFALKGTFAATKAGKSLRTMLMGLQYVIASVFITLCVIMFAQYYNMINKDRGYNRDNVYEYSPEAGNLSIKQTEELRIALMNHDNILDVSCTMIPFSIPVPHDVQPNGSDKKTKADVKYVDRNFHRMFGIDIVQGRCFDNDESDGNTCVIVSCEIQKQLNVSVGDILNINNAHGKVVGICEDIKCPIFEYNGDFQYGKDGITPVIYMYREDYTFSNFYIKFADGCNVSDICPYIFDEYERISMMPDDAETKNPLLSIIEREKIHYYLIKYMIFIFGTFSIISIIIALLGVFGMVCLETRYRRKEIAIRRINGATREEILRQLNRQYIKIVSVCYIISLVIIFPLVDLFLNNTMADRISLSPMLFIFTFFVIASISVLTVSASAWRVVNCNPTEVLSKGD